MAKKTKEILNNEESFEKKSVNDKKVLEEKIKIIKKVDLEKKDISKKKNTTTKKASTSKPKRKESSSPKLKSTIDKPKRARKETSKKSTKSNVISKEGSTIALKKPTIFTPEYYDLPYRYNQTVVKILAQTPSSLFVYWDISDEDRKNLQNTYGEHVFEITKPVLIVHNLTMNYSFEVDINDFANSWYLHINDSKCEYDIELGRKPIPITPNIITNNAENPVSIKPIDIPYIYISSSNKIESPNNKILFNNINNKVKYRNVKTNEIIEKDITAITFISNIGRFYNISDISELYEKFYKEDKLINNDYILKNPGSGNPSSRLSSKFK